RVVGGGGVEGAGPMVGAEHCADAVGRGPGAVEPLRHALLPLDRFLDLVDRLRRPDELLVVDEGGGLFLPGRDHRERTARAVLVAQPLDLLVDPAPVVIGDAVDAADFGPDHARALDGIEAGQLVGEPEGPVEERADGPPCRQRTRERAERSEDARAGDAAERRACAREPDGAEPVTEEPERPDAAGERLGPAGDDVRDLLGALFVVEGVRDVLDAAPEGQGTQPIAPRDALSRCMPGAGARVRGMPKLGAGVRKTSQLRTRVPDRPSRLQRTQCAHRFSPPCRAHQSRRRFMLSTRSANSRTVAIAPSTPYTGPCQRPPRAISLPPHAPPTTP